MTVLTPMSPQQVAEKLKTGAAALVDVREPDEFAREHVPGARSLPLSALLGPGGQAAGLTLDPAVEVVFHCKSGLRTATNCARLAAIVTGPASTMEGGLEAWKSAGLPITTDAKAPLELNRQVQIVIGAAVLIGVTLALVVDPAFLAVPAFFGAGLLFAGVSGWCGLARLLALAPWNRPIAAR